MSDLARRDASGTLEVLAAEINAEHRACEVAASTAIGHAIRCGELLLEAKKRAGHGGWTAWLREKFEGSHDLANKYMKVAQNQNTVLNLERNRPLSLRGALEGIKKHEKAEKRRERQERSQRWAEENEEERREFITRVRDGRVRIPLLMAVSHTYDFEERPKELGDWSEPVLCLVEESNGIGSFIRQPDWDNWDLHWDFQYALELEPGDEERLAKLCGSREAPAYADLEASSRLVDEELNYCPQIRELSWDGTTLLLPTGHLEARLVDKVPFVWWEWDELGKYETESMLAVADPQGYKPRWLQTLSLLEKVQRENGTWGRPIDATELEAALAADLEAVRAYRRSEPPDLADPRVVYEIGERVLDEYQKGAAWRRFAAFVKSGAAS